MNNCLSLIKQTLDSLIILIRECCHNINCMLCNISNKLNTNDINRFLTHNNPMTIAAEYPSYLENRIVFSTDVLFNALLNTKIYIIFRADNMNENLPVYFKDDNNYEHSIVLTDNTPVLLNQLQSYGIYSANYQHNRGLIILDNLTPINPNIIN